MATQDATPSNETLAASVSAIRDEIISALADAGVRRLSVEDDIKAASEMRQARVTFELHRRRVLITAWHRPADKAMLDHERKTGTSLDRHAIEVRAILVESARVWRILADTITARLTAVREGIESFDAAFLPYLVDEATGRTFFQRARAGTLIELSPKLRPEPRPTRSATT